MAAGGNVSSMAPDASETALPVTRLATPAPSSAAPLEPIDLWHEFPELGAGLRDALRSYASNTQLGLRADWRRWRAWCARQKSVRPVYPAEVADVIAFALACSPPLEIDNRGVARLSKIEIRARVRSASTLRRYLHTIGAMHRLARLPDPTKDPEIAAVLRRVTRGRGAKRQKAALNRPQLELLLATLGNSLWDLRARALLLTAYCSLARSAELVALTVDDLKVAENGDGYAVLRRTKTDQQGHGSHRYLAEAAVDAIRAWLTAARISEGAIFRRLHKHGVVTASAIAAHEVARIVNQVIRRLPRDARPVGSFAGHSTRIGAAQDLVAAGQDLLSVMQAGGWKDPKMPARYTEHLAAMRGGMARLWGRTPLDDDCDTTAALVTSPQREI